MMRPGDVLSDEAQKSTADLAQRLLTFYQCDREYFEACGDKPEFWGPIREDIGRRLGAADTCKVLEFGAGRTGFGSFLGALRPRVKFHVQDITELNRGYLEHEGDEVHIGDLSGIHGEYDIIFSTFVWEHLTEPSQTLQWLLEHLAPGGTLYLISPRYDVPLYIPPSARWYSRAEQLQISVWLQLRRLRTLVTRRPSFLIHHDPSVFHLPWYTDADAIHWPSIWDLSCALPAGYEMTRLRIPVQGFSRRIWERFLLLSVKITRAV